jgi:hypothetical protein
LFFVCLFVLNKVSISQENASNIKKVEEDKFLYRNEKSYGAYIHSAIGAGAFYRRGWHVTGTRKKMYEIEANNFKHPKEIKSYTSGVFSGSSYIYGKLNNILLLRGGVGYQNVIYKKSERRNVEISYLTFTGVTLAMSKPVYLLVYDTASASGKSEQKYDPLKHSETNIAGKASFTTGMNNISFIPAGYLKMGLSFDYSEKYDYIKALETGIIMDAYLKPLEIMAFIPKQNLLFSLYVKMVWGEKWF